MWIADMDFKLPPAVTDALIKAAQHGVYGYGDTYDEYDTLIVDWYDLKEIGYQVGSGFMMGSPYQTTEHLIDDIRFLQELQPDMIGIGPYITHKDTPFSSLESGSLLLTLRLISVLRLMFP